MVGRIPHQRRIIAFVGMVLGMCAAGHAQSALDRFDPGANGTTLAMAIQPDGKIVVGGSFTTIGGGASGSTSRAHLARLNADGSVDAGFNPGANNEVRALLVQADGKILVAGDFTALGGGTGTTARNRIGRLNPDGSVDPGFNPGANSSVRSLAVQPDGKIIVVGDFSTFGGGGAGTTGRSRIARVNADGSLDTGFNPGAGPALGAQVNAVAVQPDGKIVVGGFFAGLGGGIGATPRRSLGRLNPDGSVDATFDQGANTNSVVYSLAVQPDGKMVVGGFFAGLGGNTGSTLRANIARLNADGSIDTAFNPGASDRVLAVALQPDGKILVGGDFSGLGGGSGATVRYRIGRINVDGSLDSSFDPGANDQVHSVIVQPDGKILLGGFFTTLGGGGNGTTPRARIGRLYPDGTMEVDFNPGVNPTAVPPFNSNPSVVYALAVQRDHKILAGGNFTGIGGGNGTTPRTDLARLNVDGSVDASFTSGTDGKVLALALQPDGKIIVGGAFSLLGDVEEYNLGRLNADGSPDTSMALWTNGAVNTLALQPDGRILVGGEFTSIFDDNNSVSLTLNRIARLNADGSIDSSFNPGVSGAAGGLGPIGVYTLAVQPDGQILVGGHFDGLGGGTGTTPRANIGRLNADGTVDMSFNPGASSNVHAFAVQPDGKIVVGGAFGALGGTPRSRIGRLNANGSIDTLFNPGANIFVYAIALQADGRVLVGGSFSSLGSYGRAYIGRITTDGSIDEAFDPGANDVVFSLALEADGKILAGGYFSTLGGGELGKAARIRIGRVTNPDAAVQRLVIGGGGAVVAWWRGGAAPELARVTFEGSADGTTYTALGNASRVAGGWQLGGLALGANQNRFVRARGYFATGYQNASGSVVESIRNGFAAPCVFTLSSPSASVPSGVHAGSVMLTANDPLCAWTAPNNAFVTVTSNSSGMGTTLVTWVTSINPGTSPRVATLTIAGLPFTITQAGASTTRRVDLDFNHDAISDIAVFRPGLGRWFVMGQMNTDWGVPGDMPVPGDYDGDGNPDVTVFRPSNGTWYVKNGATVVWGLPGDIPVPGDYNGDHVTDMAVFRPSTGEWLVRSVATTWWGLSGDLPVPADYNGDGTTDLAVYRPSTGLWFVRNITTAAYGLPGDIPVPADYNGDGSADIAVFRPATGMWLIMAQYTAGWGAPGDVPVAMDRSGDGVAELGVFRRATGTWYFKNHNTEGSELILWGAAGDIPLGRALPPVMTPAGDFDGDRKADLTVFRPSTGDWVTDRSLSGFIDYTINTFGLNGDNPVARDYDGDGKIDPAVFRPSTNRWYMLRSSTDFADYLWQDWGLGGDIPVPGDYDGDGKADVAVFRPSVARWLILLSSSGNTMYLSQDFGLNGDIPMPADYDGDGRTDVAVFRPSTGDWYIYNRVTSTYQVVAWGLNGDVPAPADFDGDGKADVAVFRPSLGRWFIKSSIDGSSTVADWGLSGDVMVPADFDGDGKADIAVFRPSNGMWYVRGLFNRSWGLAGDIPALKSIH